MEALELKSKKREILGKKVKTLRNKGLLPAVVYGGDNRNQPLALDAKEFQTVWKKAGETTLVKLFVDNDAKNVLVYDVFKDPVTGEVKHVDFYEVRMDEKVTAKIPVVFTGSSPAVADLGGVLVKALEGLEVRALPGELPREILVDVSKIKTFEDNVLVKDIKLPESIEILENGQAPVVSVVPPRSEAEIEALTEEVVAKVEEVKVETEEKAAARAAAPEGGEPAA